SLGERATAIETELARDLGVSLPATPWHSARDGLARLGTEAALLTGSAGKIARDVTLLMQSEIADAAEAMPGGASSMAHNRNPPRSRLALGAALRGPGLAATLLVQLPSEHERGIGQWQAQWLTLRELLCAAASALAAMGEVLETLQVDEARMRVNLERS